VSQSNRQTGFVYSAEALLYGRKRDHDCRSGCMLGSDLVTALFLRRRSQFTCDGPAQLSATKKIHVSLGIPWV
jgi:hypothetical protein